MLTEREEWLMNLAYRAGQGNNYLTLEGWLEDSAADGVTAEMVLAKEAP